ncbi:ubiquitin carboxyl-terminal hydrolase 13 [Medicago truncatula]|uniref:ubiquitin carboxyl-terminal hydrolase 13 n=1 Tax=Medicago truncatula TaxID=3880 RepID=UPI000D2F293D|nr:ubiquitin carboxyl-terminal hydrolase 13 [Medicago truncatula]
MEDTSYQWGDNVGDLSIFLSVVETANMSKGWSRHVKFKLFVLNQVDSNRTIFSDEAQHEFTASSNGWGVGSLVSSTVLHDPHSGFLVKDVCIVGVEVSFYKSKYKKQVNQATSLTTSSTSSGQTENLEVEVTRPMLEVPGQNQGEHMDFKGLGQI